MLNRKTNLKIRKAHRYLGIIIGIQFIFWTISGLYFSWTNLDEIHGDHLKNLNYEPKPFTDLISPSEIDMDGNISSIELRDIDNAPYYWVNRTQLYNARDGKPKDGVTEEEALSIAKRHLIDDLEIESVERINETGKHHEYRERLLPAFVINYKTNDNVKAYVSVKDGKFQAVRHRSWRWFDFLWMTHTMDYEGRDNFNTTVLRVFSLMGLITVLSGFLLAFVSSRTLGKLSRKFLLGKR